MEKEKKIITWSLYEDEGYWKYSFGLKDKPVTTSRRIMTKERAIQQFNNEVNTIKRQLGDKYEIVIVQI